MPELELSVMQGEPAGREPLIIRPDRVPPSATHLPREAVSSQHHMQSAYGAGICNTVVTYHPMMSSPHP